MGRTTGGAVSRRRPAVIAALLAAALVAANLAAAPASAAGTETTPTGSRGAQALAASCPAGTFGPYWFAGNGASNARGERVVIDAPSNVNGVRIYIYGYHGGPNQLWCMDRRDANNSMYLMRNLQSGRCLKANGDQNGAAVVQETCSNVPAQQWFQVYVGKRVVRQGRVSQYVDTYEFKNALSSRCLDVANYGTTNGSLLQVWTCNGTTNQYWF
jgi:hypothetical protein